MSGIATSLSRYTPISDSPISHSLNLGARFLLGCRIVTPASRTVRSGSADSLPGSAQIIIWIDVGPTCHSSLPPHFVQSRAELVRSPRRRPFRRSPSSGHQTSIPCASTFPGTSSTVPNPQPGFSPAEIAPGMEPLGALLHLRSASPVVLRPNRPREWIRGELFVLPGLFPLLLCAAGAGE